MTRLAPWGQYFLGMTKMKLLVRLLLQLQMDQRWAMGIIYPLFRHYLPRLLPIHSKSQ